MIPSIAAALALAAAPTFAPEIEEALGRVPDPCPSRPRLMQAFYRARGHTLAWLAQDGRSQAARDLLANVAAAPEHGIDPARYHLSELERALREAEGLQAPARDRAVLDVRLTALFLEHAAHLLIGRVDPETFDRECHVAHEEGDLAAALQAASSSGLPGGVLDGLGPDAPPYGATMAALRRYRSQPPWVALPDGAPLAFGDSGARVALLRVRLAQEGFVGAGAADPETFDGELERAVVCFQESRGLEPDGRVGDATLQRLRVPPPELVRKLVHSLERWRWLPRHLGDPHVLVNVAGFRLQVVARQAAIIDMRVVAGRAARRTPSFSSEVTDVIFSPFWYVPRGIALKDKLPKMRKGISFLAEQGYRVYATDGGKATAVDPSAVDWSKVSAASFGYRIVQSPGPKNALGGVKFVVPNRHDVFLHDTPERRFFEKAQRSFSSGCIRLERPADLAAWILRDMPEWDATAMAEAMKSGCERRVPVKTRVPVHLVYLTAWAEPDGTVHFRDDLYGRDEKLASALATAERPGP